MAFEAPEANIDTSDAPLAVDEAVNLLTAADEDLAPEGDEDATAQSDEDEADDQAADGDDAPDDDDPASEDDPEEDDEGEPDADPAIEPPKFWSAEEKALFAKAPPEVQHLIAAKDAAAEQRVYQAKEEAAEARKEASVIGEVRQRIDQQLERAEQVFKGRWDGVDFAAWAQTDPQEAFAAKLEFDQEQKELEDLRTASAATEQAEHRQFLRDTHNALAEEGHPLADPVKGKEAKTKLLNFALERGFEASDLKWAGAKELKLLHDAMELAELKARLAHKPQKQPPSEAKKPGAVRPTGAPPTRRETQAKQRKSVLGRAYATGRMDDAVAALLAMES